MDVLIAHLKAQREENDDCKKPSKAKEDIIKYSFIIVISRCISFYFESREELQERIHLTPIGITTRATVVHPKWTRTRTSRTATVRQARTILKSVKKSKESDVSVKVQEVTRECKFDRSCNFRKVSSNTYLR
jgi:hypothetical protein